MSSYIAVELDALNKAPGVARAARCAEDVVIGGLVRLWAYAFREKRAELSSLEVRGCFDTEADVVPALTAFGFLEPQGEVLRVRGAERYLRIAEARSKGGKAASGNLKRGHRRPSRQPAASRGAAGASAGNQPEVQPGVSSGSAPALTPTTDDRLPTTESTAGVGRKPPTPPASRETDGVLDDFASAGFGKYQWQGAKDGTAWALLRAHSTVEEIRSRWRRGLANAKADRFPRVATVAELHQHWNRLAVDAAGTGRPDESTKVYPEGNFL